MKILKRYTAPGAFGDISVSFQRALIAVYFSIVIACLWAIDWQYFSWISFAVVFYLALLVADFGSGLVHLYIDYRPLNYAKNYDKLFFFKGEKDTEEFIELKREIVRNSTWFDYIVYAFKAHHRHPEFNIGLKYRDFFVETAIPGYLFLFFAVFVLVFFPEGPWAGYFALFDVVFSVAIIHTDMIHVWMHGSTTMPLGVKFVRFLEKMKLIYSVETHNIHHKDGLSGFCFIMGHTNFAVNWICKKLLERGIIHAEDWYGFPRKNQANQSSV